MTMDFYPKRHKLDARDIVGGVVFCLIVLVTCLVWLHVKDVAYDGAKKRFDEIALVQRDLLIGRMKDYEQVLLGAAGLFASSAEVDRAEWREYIDSLRLDLTLPGIQGVGYAVMIPSKDKAKHEAKIRAEGFPNYVISPPGEREVYSSIIYLEPFSGRNLRAFGYDMYSEPTRRLAMQRAADTRDPAWTGRVTLIQEDGQKKQQPGFLVYVPIYAKNKPLRTVEERRTALVGFVYSPFRAWDLLGQLYQDQSRLFDLELYAGPVDPQNLLYETAAPALSPAVQVDLPVDIGGTRWVARFTSNENFAHEEFSDLPLVLFLAAIAMECLLFMTFVLDARHRKHVEAATRELEKSNREIRLLARLTQLLQNCNTEGEAYPILDRVMNDLFMGTTGACYILDHSETQLELLSAWGPGKGMLAEFFEPDACWAFRRGQKHSVGALEETEVRCEHVGATVGSYVCIPLLAQGKVIGGLYVEQPAANPLPAFLFTHYADLLSSVADTLSLSLSNLRLRNSLRDLSIRDSLTGLYNRRYMEEGLDRELERAERQQHDVAVVMLDVDHFKLLNDTYGHDAGDVALKRIADQMKHFRSGSDLVCRFGGEEFVLILPDISEAVLQDRLETLRREVADMQINFEGRILPMTTISMGVAIYPRNGHGAGELLRRADSAMYRAKQNGRNRIEWAESDVPDFS